MAAFLLTTNAKSQIVYNTGSESNLQAYSPAALLNPGQIEVKSFNSMFTQTKYFTSTFETKPLRGTWKRQTWFSSINQALFGLSHQINVGFDIWIKSVAYKSNTSSPFTVLGFKNTNTSRTAITGFGPKIKIAPFPKLAGFSVQTSLLFPMANDLEGRDNEAKYSGIFLEHDRTLWRTQFFYDKHLGGQSQIFLQLAPWVYFTRDSYRKHNAVETPLSVFYNYFPSNRVTVYFMTEYWPNHYNANKQQFSAFASYFAQSGLGAKYELIKTKLEIEVLYSQVWAGSEFSGAGQSLGLGLRFIN